MGYSVPVSGNRMVYGGYLMRSNLEVNLAIALDAHRVTWQYEAETMELPDGRGYVPDFTIAEDPLNVADGADIIEVKDKKHVWRCAETLGLGDARGEMRRSWNWTPPRHAREHDLTGQFWGTLDKPIQAALMGKRVLIVGATSVNAAVILMGGGLMSAKRHHGLMQRIQRSITLTGDVWATRQDVLDAAKRLDEMSGIWGQAVEFTGTDVKNVTMITNIREIFDAAQKTADDWEAAAV